MKLTKQEQAMVARLRMQCEFWQTHRKQNITWLVLFIVLLAAGLDFSNFPRLPAFNEISHLSLIKFGVLLFWVRETFRNWNGPPAETLLLRLIDEETKKGSEPVGVDDVRM